MFNWANAQLEKLSKTVAPPPTDPAHVYSTHIQNGNETGALSVLSDPNDPLDPHALLNVQRGTQPVHLAAQYACLQVLRTLIQHYRVNPETFDLAGNTPLHYASSSASPRALDALKCLISEFKTNVTVRNSTGDTPYDVATRDGIRQYLLPIQLQKETQIALDNGGAGLPPGIDMGGLKVSNPNLAPPPIREGQSHGGPPPGGAAGPPPMVGVVQQQPAAAGSRYAATPLPGMSSTASGPGGHPGQKQPLLAAVDTTSPQALGGHPQQAQASPLPQQQLEADGSPFIPPAGAAAAVQSPVAAGDALSLKQPPAEKPATAAAAPTQAAPKSAPVAQSTASSIPTAPISGSGRSYARTGYSSAATGASRYRPDGFHSSSSDVSLQKLYCHTKVNDAEIAPPPSSGGGAPISGNTTEVSGIGNPYATGTGGPLPRAGSMGSKNRYLAYDAVTGRVSQPSAYDTTAPNPYALGSSNSGASMPAAAAVAPIAAPNDSNFNVFNPATAVPKKEAVVLSPSVPEGKKPAEKNEKYTGYAEQQAKQLGYDRQTGQQAQGQEPYDQVQEQQQQHQNQQPDSQVGVSAGQSAAEMTVTAAATAATSLPPGWVELHDPNTNRPYYLDETNNFTTWERPVSAVAPILEPAPPARQAEEESVMREAAKAKEGEAKEDVAAGRTEVNADAAPQELPSTEVDANATASSETFETPSKSDDTKPTSSGDKEAAALASSAEAVFGTSSEIAKADTAGTPAAGVRAFGPAAATTDDANPTVTEVAVTAGSSQTADDGIVPLPPGWVELHDPNSNMPYYYDQKNNVTAWERPAPAPTPAPASAGVEAEAAVATVSEGATATKIEPAASARAQKSPKAEVALDNAATPGATAAETGIFGTPLQTDDTFAAPMECSVGADAATAAVFGTPSENSKAQPSLVPISNGDAAGTPAATEAAADNADFQAPTVSGSAAELFDVPPGNEVSEMAPEGGNATGIAATPISTGSPTADLFNFTSPSDLSALSKPAPADAPVSSGSAAAELFDSTSPSAAASPTEPVSSGSAAADLFNSLSEATSSGHKIPKTETAPVSSGSAAADLFNAASPSSPAVLAASTAGASSSSVTNGAAPTASTLPDTAALFSADSAAPPVPPPAEAMSPMTEVDLSSPPPPSSDKGGGKVSNGAAPPVADSTTPDASSFFTDIGLPPPPFSSRQ